HTHTHTHTNYRYASVYRVRWRRNGTGSGFCISNVNHCNKEEEEDTAETRKSCCSLPESIPYIVSRDCCENNNNDDDDEIEKHQRRVTMSVRALTIPLSIAARVVRQYEMSNKNVKILSATFDFVKTRTQEWIMLQMKSFRLTKSSSLSFTSSSILPSMANITTTKNDTTQKLKKKKKISSRLHLKLRKCTICKREIERNGPSFTMTPDMMVKLTKELQIMNILSNKDDNDTNNDNYSTLVTVAERQKRRFRYRTSHVCTTCNKLYTKSRELRDKYAKQQRLLGLENVAHSKTRRTLVGQNRSTKLTSKIGHCRVYLFVHDIAKSQHSTQQSLFFTLVEKLKRHKTPSLRLALLPTGQNNTCPNLTFNIKDSKLSLRQCCAFDFFCDRETLRDLTSKHTKSRSRLKVQFALSTNDDEEENDESLYYGELPIVRESEDDMEMNENHFEHLWISLETPISYSPLRPSKDLKVRISVGMVWTRYGSDVVTSKEGLDSNLRFRKLHTRPNIYGNLNKKNVVLLSGMPSGWFTRVQIADDPETYERLKRLGWSKGEEVEEKKKKKEIEKLTSKKQISSTLRLLVNYGPDVLCEKGEMKIRDIFAEWGLEREDSNHVVSFLKNSNSWDHVVNVPRRDLWHAEIARDIQSRSCDVRAEARYHLCPEDRVDNNEDAEKEDDVGTTVVPPFVVSLLRGGHMISGSSVLPAREYFPKSFVRHLVRAAVPSVCHAVVSVGMIVDKGALLSAEIVTSAIGKLKDETVEGFCFAHGYTRLYASDYYCVECDRANMSSVG
ncbi:hypothetical protein OAV88_02655, partial [bacterium]|nr:hypothetical protein [bacterium]